MDHLLSKEPTCRKRQRHPGQSSLYGMTGQPDRTLRVYYLVLRDQGPLGGEVFRSLTVFDR